MANLPPPSNPRIVPIMARRKSLSSGPAGNRTSPPEDSAMKMHLEMAMAGMPSKSSLKLGCLDYFNLYAMPILGDGNCLFYSLSDQLYGSVDRHIEIRERLVQHMRDNADYFRDFTADVGGERRAPRRSAAQASRLAYTNVDRAATAEGQAAKFKLMLNEMKGQNAWGGSPEIQAFCQAYGLDVLVYSEDGVQRFQNFFAEADPNRGVIHLAFHSFQHYSSVRNLDGPHVGLPKLPERIKAADLIYRKIISKEPMIDQKINPENIPPEPQNPTVTHPADMHWMITIFGQRVPANDDESIRAMIGECSPNITAALNRLVENKNRALPRSSIPFSTSLSSTTTSNSVPTPRSGGSRPKSSSTMNTSSGAVQGSSSRSSSRHSVTSKRSANDSDLDEEDGTVRTATRRSRGRCRKRRMLEDVTVDILGNRSEVVAIEVNHNNDDEEGDGHNKYNGSNRDNDHHDGTNRNGDLNAGQGNLDVGIGTGSRTGTSTATRTLTGTRTLSPEPIAKEHYTKQKQKQKQTDGVIRSIENDDDDYGGDPCSVRTLSPSASQGSEATNSKEEDDIDDEYADADADEDEDEDEDEDGDGDDDADSDYKDEEDDE
ncbi:OTU-like cysteine protease family protein [Histoplasma capsulatum var. duboisii H88]|uniref:OTU-like cysteine protease family protein n=1 Tax=Ajellomyces capsulatus (strain H88) TaxID=544711 RepID=A0A8A1LJI2_AJEC8|nr:OTU-like cysteine protease family protein [Histoplasma capsulatum var. duboisii H88]